MSVLETPRIYFQGEISWDPITTNNCSQNYNEQLGDTIYPPDPKQIVESAAERVKAFRSSAIQEVASLQSWNPHGTHRSSLFNTTICGFDLGQGLNTIDPFVSTPVNLTGMLVDVEPFGGFTSQIFFDRMVFGVDGGYRILAPRTSRFIDRYVNMSRTTYPAFHAGIASVIWQTSFAKTDGLRIESFDSSALQALTAALEGDDILGLTVRFNAYRTVYYKDPSLTNGNSSGDAARQIAKLNAGGFQPNPARSLVVGVLGLWRRGEPAGEPGDRAMIQAPSSPVGSVFARVDGSNLVMDFGNSISETDINGDKQDLGTLTVLAVDPQTQAAVPLGSIDSSQYNVTAYQASAGIITMPLPQSAPDLSTLLLELRDPNGNQLLTELPLRAIPQTPNLYLDEGESTTASFQVNDRGVPVAGLSIALVMFQLDAAGDQVVKSFQIVSDSNGVVTLPLTGGPGTITAYVPSLSSAENVGAAGLNPQVNTYIYLRVRPADSYIASLSPTWANVYAHVLANWNSMAPCMDNWLKLNDPIQVKAFGPMLKQLTDPANFESYRFMPVTRDMSVGERSLLYNFLDSTQIEDYAEQTTGVPSIRSFAQRSRALRRGPRKD